MESSKSSSTNSRIPSSAPSSLQHTQQLQLLNKTPQKSTNERGMIRSASAHGCSSSAATYSNGSNMNGSSCIQRPEMAYAIVWSPLPPITWIFPFIGHTGISTSTGVVSDFRGPYYVGTDGKMAFGNPTRYIPLISMKQPNVNSSAEIQRQWDEAIQVANMEYDTRNHNICCDNCHSHVAYALNHMSISSNDDTIDIHRLLTNKTKFGMVKIATIMFFRGTFTSYTAILQQFLPFAIVVALVMFFGI